MTDRDEQLEQLTAYLDGELTQAERADVEALIDRDPAARRLLADLRQTSALIAGLPHPSAPAGFSRSIAVRLEREALLGDDRQQPPRWTFGNWSALAASIALVVAAGWWILPRTADMTGPIAATETARDGGTHVASSARKKVLMSPEAGTRMESKRVSETPASAEVAELSARPARGMAGRAASAPREETFVGALMENVATESAPIVAPDMERSLAVNCVAVSDAAQVDQSLNTGQLTPDELVNADISAFTNRITVEAPNDDAVPVLCRVVEDNCTANFVPKLENEPKDKPINRSQVFYSAQNDDSEGIRQFKSRMRRADKDEGDEIGNVESDDVPEYRVVVNVPRGQVQEMIAGLQLVSLKNGYDTNFDVNGLRFANDADPEVVTGNLRTVVDDDVATAIGLLNEFEDESSITDVSVSSDAWSGDENFDHDDSDSAAGPDTKIGQPVAPSKSEPVAQGAADTEPSKHDSTRSADSNAPEAAKPKATDRARGAPRESQTTSAPSSAGQPGALFAAATEGQERTNAQRGARTDADIPAFLRNDIVGPMPPWGAEDDLVTCVVTIRPAAARAGNSGVPVTASHPAANGTSDATGRTTPATGAGNTATSKPADGKSGG